MGDSFGSRRIRRQSRLVTHGTVIGAGLVVISCVAVQGSAAVSSPLFASMGPAGVAAWRQIVGAITLLLVFRPSMRGRNRQRWLLIMLLGTAMAAMNTTYYLSVERLPLGVAAALLYLGPFVVAVAGIRRGSQVIWPALAFFGVLAITRPDQASAIPMAGLMFGLIAAGALALYTVTSQRLGRQATLGDLALAVTFSALLLAPTAVSNPPAFTPGPLLILAGVGALGVAVGFSCDYLALRLAGTTLVATLFALDPAIGALLGLIVLGQTLSLPTLIGLASICVAGACLTRSLHRHPAAPAPQSEEPDGS